MRVRIALFGAGIALLSFGVFRLLTQIPHPKLIMLAIWLIGALIIHDGILSPLIIAVSWTLAHVVPPRARKYLQAALIAGGLVTIIAIPLIYREGKQPPNKAILRQDFGGNLTVLLGVIAAVSLLCYAVHVARDRSRAAPVHPSIETVTGPSGPPDTHPG
jgi:hypothetical protein